MMQTSSETLSPHEIVSNLNHTESRSQLSSPVQHNSSSSGLNPKGLMEGGETYAPMATPRGTLASGRQGFSLQDKVRNYYV